MTKYNTDLEHSSRYYPLANGLAKAFNKTLCKIIKKMVSRHKKDWHEHLLEALWAYRTTFHTPTQAASYSLVFNAEAIFLVEIQVPSLWVTIKDGLTDAKAVKIRLLELETLYESRLATQQHLELYRTRMARAYNKKVKLCSFTKEELVLLTRSPLDPNKRKEGKFTSKWDSPYAIEKAYPHGAYLLQDVEGNQILPVTNVRFLKKYYP